MIMFLSSLVTTFWEALHLKTLVLAVVTFLFLINILRSRHPKNYPPGPWRLPFVGNFFQIDTKQTHLVLQQFVKKYGNVFSLELGQSPVVVVSGLPLIKEMFTHLDQNFVNRFMTPVRERITGKNGLVVSNGQTWKEQRRLALMALRNFGLGKKSLEERIQEETHHLVEAIREEGGQPFNPHLKLINAVSNIICSVTFGERFDYEDCQFQELLQLLDETMHLMGSSAGQDPDRTTSFNEENLISTTLDLFLGGTETTSSTLRWALLYMSSYPEIQENVQAEIDRVIGHKRQVSLSDRESMPYTNAVIHEVQRMGNIVPLNSSREVTVDTKFNGFHLPKFVKKYGNVLSLDFANIPSVVITGMPLIKEIFTQMEHNFMNRPVTLLRKHLFNKNGLIFSSDQTWKEQRRFALMTLRNFGLGKRSLEERIQEEAHYLVEAIRDEGGQPFDPHFNISNAVSNIICSITFGERFDYHDSQFQEMLRLLDEAMCLESSMMCQLYNIFPRILQYLPGSHQTLFRNWRKLQLFVSDIVNNHRRDWDPDEPRDFIDAFLTEMTKYPDKTTTSFNEENLICSTLDLFFAGTETTSTTLRWALLCMALYPEVQEKMQAEIDRVIGQARQPNLADRDSMPYTNAVIHEVQRMGNIIPFNVPREVAVDTQLAGFNLPKGIMVLSNLTALHRDPSEWTTPDTFNPEHFLENGQFKKRESFLPFSMGKRACLGEQLARSELFIFITTLFQKFTFKPPVNEKLSLQFRMAATVSPVSHRLCAIPRL